MHAGEVEGEGQRERKGKNGKNDIFTDFLSNIANTFQCTYWLFKTNPNSIVCFSLNCLDYKRGFALDP